MLKRLLVASILALAVGVGASAALAATTKPHTWLVVLGQYNKGTLNTITVYVTGQSTGQDARAEATKELVAVGAPKPNRTLGTERVIVKAPNPKWHKWLVTLSDQGNTIQVFVTTTHKKKKDITRAEVAAKADTEATTALEGMGAPTPQTVANKSVIVKDWKLSHH